MLASGQLLLLAYPMVLVGTILTGVAVHYLVPWFDWPWSLTFTLGSILGSTDPIAVASVLKSLGAPPRLQLHLSGESTLNDGSAMVFFNVFSQLWIGSFSSNVADISVAQGFALFFQNALGGFAVGLCFAAGLLITLHYLEKRMEPDYNILQAVAAVTASYLSYYVADQLLQMSGVTASVTCAVLSKALGKGMMQDGPGMIRYLSLMEFLLNTLLFALGGVVWGSIFVRNLVDENIRFSGKQEWLWLLVVYILVLAIRAIQVGVFYPIFRRIGLRSNWREAVFLAFAGMRGAVGIALALSLLRRTDEEASRDSFTNVKEIRSLASSIFFLSGGVSLCTLLINGTAAPWVLKWLNLIQPSDRKANLDLFEVSAQEFVNKHYARLLRLPRFQKASFTIVQNHVPFLTGDCSPDTESNLSKDNTFASPPDSSPLPIVATSPEGIKPALRHRRIDSHASYAIPDQEDIEAFSLRFDRMSEAIQQQTQCDSEDPSLHTEGSTAVYEHVRLTFFDLVYDAFLERLQEINVDHDENPRKKDSEFQKLLYQDANPDVTASFIEPFADQAMVDLRMNEPERFWWNRVIHLVRKVVKRKFEGALPSRKQRCQYDKSRDAAEYRALRPTLERTVAFIGAHRRSEERFRAYMNHVLERYEQKKRLRLQEGSTDEEESGRFDAKSKYFDLLKDAIEKVLRQSEEQTSLALEKLHSYQPDMVLKVQSQIVASILLKRLHRFIGSRVQEGTLTATEAQKYLDKIKAQKEALKHCAGCEHTKDNDDKLHQVSKQDTCDS
eukprot:scaffold11728_cov171-Amphora_coffeaeformis.AAC.4